MTKYLVLIYEREAEIGEKTDPALRAEYDRHWSFIRANSAAILAGEALQPTATATSLRHAVAGDRSSDYTVTDAPFVETKEALGGFYLLEAPDLDAAIVLARQIPAPCGGLEIRPIMEFDQGADTSRGPARDR